MADVRAPGNPIQALFLILGMLFLVATVIALFAAQADGWRGDEIFAIVFGCISAFFFVLGTIIHLKH